MFLQAWKLKQTHHIKAVLIDLFFSTFLWARVKQAFILDTQFTLQIFKVCFLKQVNCLCRQLTHLID